MVKVVKEIDMASGGGRIGGRVRGAMVLIVALGCARAGAIVAGDGVAATGATSATVYTVKVPGVG